MLQDLFFIYMHFSHFIFLHVKPCKVMFTKAYLEISQTSTMELFLLQLSHILKTFFCLFFQKFEIMQWNVVITKK